MKNDRILSLLKISLPLLGLLTSAITSYVTTKENQKMINEELDKRLKQTK